MIFLRLGFAPCSSLYQRVPCKTPSNPALLVKGVAGPEIAVASSRIKSTSTKRTQNIKHLQSPIDSIYFIDWSLTLFLLVDIPTGWGFFWGLTARYFSPYSNMNEPSQKTINWCSRLTKTKPNIKNPPNQPEHKTILKHIEKHIWHEASQHHLILALSQNLIPY